MRGSLSGFNSPRGYGKDPTLKNNILPFEQNFMKEYRAIHQQNDEKSKVNLESLPFELRLKISNELSQIDCLNLMKTSKTMYYSTVIRLYQNIVIDESFSQFSKEYKFIDFDASLELSCSYIKSTFGFKRFLASYIQLYDSRCHNIYVNSNETFDITFPFIQKIQCVELPDSLNTFDYELNDNMLEFFSRLPCLKELIWLNDNFRVEYLERLPNKQSIVSLNLNLTFSNYLNELSSSFDSYLPDEVEVDKLKALNFPNLVHFQIRPYQNSKRLTRIINGLLVGDNPQKVSKQLKSLKLARFHKDMDALIPPCRDLIASNNSDVLNDIDLNTVNSIFKISKLNYLSTLTTLLFNNCLLNPADSKTLISSMNLTNLTSLELKNISEYQRIDSDVGSNHVRDLLEPSFLIQIAPHLTNVEHLLIDYREAFVDSVPSFLSSIPTKKLESLDLIVKLNETKSQYYSDLDEIYKAYAYAMSTGNKHKTLKKLSIEVKEENPFCDIDMPLESDLLYLELSKFTQLTSLRVNPGEFPYELISLIKHLPLLTTLDVFGAKAGGCPNLGLGMVHPNIYDEWFKVQHVAMLYLQHKPELKYIRINRYIFEGSPDTLEVNPRDGIDRWFNRTVRVGWP
ncbi:uncharacterized protein PRCAT00006124001 [Priceomyces carsonii]|uniref:uncharacterized protein n=1 Tax=Priceomyces carsonii TaxID=28549 RepID=UPI002ED84D8F|nr:unnamed protein product [Priceomyces carsonii]